MSLLRPLPLRKILIPNVYKLIKDNKRPNNMYKLKNIINSVKKQSSKLTPEKCTIYDTVIGVKYTLIMREYFTSDMFSIMLYFQKNTDSRFEKYYNHNYHLMRLDVIPYNMVHDSHRHIHKTAKFYKIPILKYPNLIHNNKGPHVHIMVDSKGGTLAIPINIIAEFKNLTRLKTIDPFTALNYFINCNHILLK